MIKDKNAIIVLNKIDLVDKVNIPEEILKYKNIIEMSALNKQGIEEMYNKIAELFEKDKSTISEHIKNIFEEQELDKISTVGKFPTVQIEGNRKVNRNIDYYNLDMIIAVRI